MKELQYWTGFKNKRWNSVIVGTAFILHVHSRMACFAWVRLDLRNWEGLRKGWLCVHRLHCWCRATLKITAQCSIKLLLYSVNSLTGRMGTCAVNLAEGWCLLWLAIRLSLSRGLHDASHVPFMSGFSLPLHIGFVLSCHVGLVCKFQRLEQCYWFSGYHGWRSCNKSITRGIILCGSWLQNSRLMWLPATVCTLTWQKRMWEWTLC
jgi:hypothetical protein